MAGKGVDRAPLDLMLFESEFVAPWLSPMCGSRSFNDKPVVLGACLVSANQDGLYLEQLSQFVRDAHERHLRRAHVDFLSRAEQLVALRALQEFLGSDLA